MGTCVLIGNSFSHGLRTHLIEGIGHGKLQYSLLFISLNIYSIFSLLMENFQVTMQKKILKVQVTKQFSVQIKTVVA